MKEPLNEAVSRLWIIARIIVDSANNNETAIKQVCEGVINRRLPEIRR